MVPTGVVEAHPTRASADKDQAAAIASFISTSLGWKSEQSYRTGIGELYAMLRRVNGSRDARSLSMSHRPRQAISDPGKRPSISWQASARSADLAGRRNNAPGI